MDTIKKQRNIILIYIHTFLSTFILYYICDTLFYIERGLTSSQYISNDINVKQIKETGISLEDYFKSLIKEAK